MSRSHAIGALSHRTGVKIPTIRYYEEIGLLPAAIRSGGGRRVYQDADVRRLAFIRHARDLGFEIDAIRDLLQLADRRDGPCAAADAIARRHAVEIDQKIAKLKHLRRELSRMIDGCHQSDIRTCKVIEALAGKAH
ncbi:MAG: helix-turn-helix domain-containing protein [Hyphomicrobiaceae bacterium]